MMEKKELLNELSKMSDLDTNILNLHYNENKKFELITLSDKSKKLIGYGFLVMPTPDIAILERYCIDESCRRKGLGKKFYEDEIQKFVLEKGIKYLILVPTEHSKNFWLKIGFGENNHLSGIIIDEFNKYGITSRHNFKQNTIEERAQLNLKYLVNNLSFIKKI